MSVAPTGVGFGGFNVPLSSCSVRNSGFGFSSVPTVRSPGSFRRPPWRGSRKTRRSWCVTDRARRNPGSRNRPGWFMDRSDRPPLRIALSARNAFATVCNTPQPSYYSKLRHPYLNTMLSSWPISGRSNTMRAVARLVTLELEDRRRRPSTGRPARLPHDRHFSA